MTRESNFWRTVRRNLPGYWVRLENSVGSGVPDTVAVLEGWTVFVELKSLVTWTRTLGVSKAQTIWLQRWCRKGGDGWVLVKVQGDVLLIHGSNLPVDGADRAVWEARAEVVCKGKTDWDLIACALKTSRQSKKQI